MKSILNIFKGKEKKERRPRVKFDKKIHVCSNLTPTRPPPKKASSFRDDTYIGKTEGYNTVGKARTRKPLESCPGNIARVSPITTPETSPSSTSVAYFDEEEELSKFERKPSLMLSDSEQYYYYRYQHYKNRARFLSNQNIYLQTQLCKKTDTTELQRLQLENEELRSKYLNLLMDRDQPHHRQPAYFHQMPMSGYPYNGFAPPPPRPPGCLHPLSFQSQNTVNADAPPSSEFPTYDFPTISPSQYDQSETDNNTDHGSPKNIFGNSIPKIPIKPQPSPIKFDDDEEEK